MHDVCFGVGHAAFDLVDVLGHELNRRDDCRDVDIQHIADRLAHIQRVQNSESLCVLVNQLRVSIKNIHTFARREPRPTTTAECFPCGGHCRVHIFFVSGGNRCDCFAVRRIDRIEPGTINRVTIIAVDEKLRLRRS